MKTPKNTAPPHEEVARLAYAIWEREGRPHGRAVEHWLQALVQWERSKSGSAPVNARGGTRRKLGLIELTSEPAPRPGKSK